MHQFAHRQRRDIVGPAHQLCVAILVTDDDAGHLVTIMLNTDNLFPHPYRVAPLAYDGSRPFPQFTWTATRITELVDQSSNDCSTLFTALREQGILDRFQEIQSLNTLGSPVGR